MTSTIETEDVVEAIADALAKLPCRDFEGVGRGEHDLDILRRREAARAALSATPIERLREENARVTAALTRCQQRMRKMLRARFEADRNPRKRRASPRAALNQQ